MLLVAARVWAHCLHMCLFCAGITLVRVQAALLRRALWGGDAVTADGESIDDGVKKYPDEDVTSVGLILLVTPGQRCTVGKGV